MKYLSVYVLETKAEIIDKYWYYSIKRIMLIIVNDIDIIDEFTDKSVINFYTFILIQHIIWIHIPY